MSLNNRQTLTLANQILYAFQELSMPLELEKEFIVQLLQYPLFINEEKELADQIKQTYNIHSENKINKILNIVKSSNLYYLPSTKESVAESNQGRSGEAILRERLAEINAELGNERKQTISNN